MVDRFIDISNNTKNKQSPFIINDKNQQIRKKQNRDIFYSKEICLKKQGTQCLEA